MPVLYNILSKVLFLDPFKESCTMKRKKSEKGQALILIVFGIVALIGMTGLAIDGGNAYSDRRNAQNAADTAALAGALAHTHATDMAAAAQDRATSNGYNGTGTNVVTVTVADTASGICPGNQTGKDVTVQITSNVKTFFATVLGVSTITNKVTASARSCDTYIAPMFGGNAIVGLSPTGTDFSTAGTPDFNVTGGGIFSNSSSSPSAGCSGAATVESPSVTTVGGTTSFSCGTTIGTTTTGATPYLLSDYLTTLPPPPACDGTAYQSAGNWYPQAGKDGSQVAISGDMTFTPGLYCISNSPGQYHGNLVAIGVTFYIMNSNFTWDFNGGGNIQASGGLGRYKGVLLFSSPKVSGGALQQTQVVDLHGNGNAVVKGSIILPSATVTMYGNSGTNNGYDTQVIGYQVSAGGSAAVRDNYNAGDNYQPPQPYTVSLIK
jgi:Flp pilus assembly protein TadG